MRKILTASLVAAGLALALPFGTAQADDDQVATAGHISLQYQCDLGDKFILYRNAGDDSYVNLRWRNKLYRLNRQKTTTGAGRYEDGKSGLVLINIPSKSMLFDAKKGRQLANECRNPEQARQHAAAKRASANTVQKTSRYKR